MFHKIAEFILNKRITDLENRVAELEKANDIKILQVDMSGIGEDLRAWLDKKEAELLKDDSIPLDPESFGVKKKHPVPPRVKTPPIYRG